MRFYRKCIINICFLCINAKAANNENIPVDNYELIADNNVDAEDNIRGVHLMDGISSISKAGVGKVYLYASTTANHDVDYLSVTVFLEKYNQATEAWSCLIDLW